MDEAGAAGTRHANGENGGLGGRVLVLNKFYAAIRVINAKRAFILLVKESAEVVDHDDGQFLTFDFVAWIGHSERVVGGAAVALVSIQYALVIDAATFVVSYVLLLAFVRDRPAGVPGLTGVRQLLRDVREGADDLFGDPARRSGLPFTV